MDEDEARKSLVQELPHVWLWSDPFFFLDKKKGDSKDHSLLLVGYLCAAAVVCYSEREWSTPST